MLYEHFICQVPKLSSLGCVFSIISVIISGFKMSFTYKRTEYLCKIYKIIYMYISNGIIFIHIKRLLYDLSLVVPWNCNILQSFHNNVNIIYVWIHWNSMVIWVQESNLWGNYSFPPEDQKFSPASSIIEIDAILFLNPWCVMLMKEIMYQQI